MRDRKISGDPAHGGVEEGTGRTSVIGEDAVFFIIILASVIIMFVRVVLNPDGLIFSHHSDIVDQFYPWRLVADRASGDPPYWNPFNFSGEPLLANMQLAYYYPPNIILFTILPVQSAFGFSFMVHLFFAGSSVYLIARKLGLDRFPSLISAEVLIFSGYFMGHIYSGHYGQVCSASWIPATLLLFMITLETRSWKWGLVLGAAVGIQFLAGHIQISLFSVYMMLIYLIVHMAYEFSGRGRIRRALKKVGAILLGAVVALAISSLQVIPTLGYTMESTRSGGVSYGFATGYSLPPWNIVTALVPGFFGDPVSGNYWNLWNYWELNYYIGIPALFLVFLSFRYWRERRLRFFLILGGVSLILALGRYLPVYWVLWRFVPVFDIIRVPSRFILLTILSFSILAGFGAQHLTGPLGAGAKRSMERYGRWMIGSAVGGVFLAIMVLLFSDTIAAGAIGIGEEIIGVHVSGEGKDVMGSAVPGIARGFMIMALFLSLTGLYVRWRKQSGSSHPRKGSVLVALVFINLLVVNVAFIDSRDLSEVYPESEYLEFLRENSDGFRVYDEAELIRDNHEIVHGLRMVGGYNPLELGHYQDLVPMIKDIEHTPDDPILDLLSVKYIITDRRGLDSDGLRLVLIDGNAAVYRNPDPMPMAFIATSHRILEEEDALDTMDDPEFEPTGAVILNREPGPPAGESGDPSGPTGVNITCMEFSRMEMDVNLREPGYLVISKAHYPEWRARVDGESAEIYRAYHALDAVRLNAGTHRVTLFYDNSFGI